MNMHRLGILAITIYGLSTAVTSLVWLAQWIGFLIDDPSEDRMFIGLLIECVRLALCLALLRWREV